MSRDNPLFSIVMPTRNRGNLLHQSLRSALAQDFDDFEVIVVNNDCSDDTDAVVESLRTERVRYIKTGRMLAMPDNWEFAWGHAKGEYVTYLCDDDALVPSALRYLADNALGGRPEVVSWDAATYYYPEGSDQARRNVLTIKADSGQVETWESRTLLDQAYRFEFKLPLPKMLNCCVDRRRFDQLRDRLGRIFWPSCPDYSTLSIALHSCPEVRIVRRPLMIWGESPQSIGATTSTSHGEATRNYRKEFGEFDFFRGTPIDVPVVTNYIAATFVLLDPVIRQVGLDPHPIDWEAFLTRAALDFKALEAHLPDRAQHAREILKAAGPLSEDCRTKIAEILDKKRRTRAHPLGRLIESSAFLSRIETALRFRGDARRSRRPPRVNHGVYRRSNAIVVKGDEAGPRDIFEMAAFLDHYASDSSETSPVGL